MPRDYKVYLDDIAEAARKIVRYTEGYSTDAFVADSKTIDAVVRNLEIIGEAVKQLPAEVKQADAEVEWHKIADLRDILIHAYFGVDLEIVWDIVNKKLPALEKRVGALLRESESHLS